MHSVVNGCEKKLVLLLKALVAYDYSSSFTYVARTEGVWGLYCKNMSLHSPFAGESPIPDE